MDLSKTFSNTDYLGAGEHPDFQKYLLEGFKKYGFHFAGSRLSNTCLGVYDELESFIAGKFGAKAALAGSSGSLMGAMVNTFCRTLDAVYCHSDIHPALSFNLPGAFYYEDPEVLKGLLMNQNYNEIAIIENSINPITLTRFDWQKLSSLPQNICIHLIIDDSHGIGITGKHGLGIFGSMPVLHPNIKLTVLASLGKAYSLPGGILFGDEDLIAFVRHLPQWGGSSPMPPAYAGAFMEMQDVYCHGLEVLKENMACFLEHVDHNLIRYLEDFPVYVLKPSKMLSFLRQFGFTISSFGYPGQESPKVERIVINSAKKKNDVLRLAEAVNLKTSIA